MIVEICCGSYSDCLNAYRGKAKRVELNSALHLGGLTPSLASLKLTKLHTDLKVIAMVRPRSAGFCYNEEEKETMKMDARILMEHGCDGIAFGFLQENGSIDLESTQSMVKLIKSFGAEKEAVFHRAFDCVNNPFEAIDQLVVCGIDRILTSGLQATAWLGKTMLAQLVEYSQGRIEILAGSGVNASNAISLMKDTGVNQIHSSCKDWEIDPTTTRNGVSYAYHESNDYEIVSEEKVHQLVNLIKTTF